MEFHSLVVSAIEALTDDAVELTLAVPDHLKDTFTYRAGQHVTLRAIIDGSDIRRSYSICAAAGRPDLRVGIRRLDGGVFSTWATTRLEVGATVEAMPPVGEFSLPAASGPRHVAAIAAGSGITPVLSIIATVLETEPKSTATLMLGNRTASSIMFLEALEGIKDRFTDRFHLVHILSREGHANPLLSGRIDADKLTDLFGTLIDEDSVDEWFLCGPYGMVETARVSLLQHQVDPGRVHVELFFAGPPTDTVPAAPDTKEGASELTFTLEGRTSVVQVDPIGPSLLDHALRVRPELPFSCKGGACATCKARLVRGEVSMDQNWALVPSEVEEGLILTCQSHPLTPMVEVDFDV